MVIESLSAKRLAEIVSALGTSETVGLDTLREIGRHARAAAHQLDDPRRQVVAWVLAQRMHVLGDRFEADPMTVEASEVVMAELKTTVRDALVFLGDACSSDAKALQLALRLIREG